MTIIRSVKKMQLLSRRMAARGKTIGIVPTMGFLHEGHLSLIRRAKMDADVVVVTIFVNPTQFGPNEDFARYPRDERGDVKKIESAGGDVAFIPRASEIYPAEFQTYVTVEQVTQTLEGMVRPGHFRGVTTIVAKLFNVVRPDVAVFGMKDFQQATVLKRMTEDLGYPIKFKVAPTVRERDGLAMSSRNKYLGTEARREALGLYRAVRVAREMVKDGEFRAGRIRSAVRRTILANCPSARIDYIAFTLMRSLAPVKTIQKDTVVSLAVRVHGVRLIDNLKLR